MNFKISYSKRSLKFLTTNKDLINEEQADELLLNALRKIFLKQEINIDLKKMRGTVSNLYRIRKGKIRIIFTIEKTSEIYVNVNEVGFRGDVYK